MNARIDKLSSALGEIDAAYLEEALRFTPEGRGRARNPKKVFRLPKLSAACVILLLLSVFVTSAFAVSAMSLSWRDIFRPEQTVIDDADEAPVISSHEAGVEDIKIDVVKAISDERVLYLLYSVKANDGALLASDGRFAVFDLYFPGKRMSGVYQQYLLGRREGLPESELEGVICADWQADANVKNAVLTFSDWQEKKLFEDVKVDFNVAEMAVGKNAELPVLYTGHEQPAYLWQPGSADVKLPYGGISICSAGWESGILQLVMKGPKNVGEWSEGKNWYFIDTRTGTIIRPEPSAYYHTPDELGRDTEDADQRYFWNFVPVEREALPYLEMHWGGQESFADILPGTWEVRVDKTPVTIQSKLLAEDVALSYDGQVLLADKIECSKLSMAIYFPAYVDSTTGILRAFEVFDAAGKPIRCDWGFTADADGRGCMIWTRFEEPIDPESVCRLDFCGNTIFAK